MLSLSQNSNVQISENQIYQCETAGIYVQGEDSNPKIVGNTIKFCVCSGIQISNEVQAEIILNTLNFNDTGIVIFENDSICRKNIIESSHLNGILITSKSLEGACMPNFYENIITLSKHNGVLIEGKGSLPKFEKNTIDCN